MVRLYLPKSFKVGEVLSLPDEELRYFRSVRRGQGQINLFNGLGQNAYGELTSAGFRVDRVEVQTSTVIPLRVAMGLPETSVVSDLVRQFSELGVQKLNLFKAGRSQKADARLNSKLIERLHKISVESCRQSGRGTPLEVELIKFQDLQGSKEANRFVLDEAQGEFPKPNSKANEPCVIAIGCEGGWTEEERSSLVDFGFQRLHWRTNVLKVDTACLLGCSWAMSEIFQMHR